ncbi:histidinol-phosphate aminotransferase [Candidatus Hakubella thermalkaliphila]|nr:histidinol-phosphate aminotransferase [Candidatus Hakubella thermalkaliphila]
MTETLVVVDEAYGEFCPTSVIDLTNRHANLAVVKTFSKALRLAGARVGVLVASEPIVKEVQKVKLP